MTGPVRLSWRRTAIAVLALLPVASLALAAFSWLRFGMDLPLWDDWRTYRNGTAGSLAPAYLFAPENDTLYPVGKALDALAFRFLDGNTVAYQLLSMLAVLGLLLALQWRLLRASLGDRLPAASAFVLTLFMLQPETYWGLQNLAFHQAIPLVCCLAALVVVLGARWQRGWSVAALVLLALLAGFSYISGAFAMLAVALVLLLAAPFIQPAERAPLLRGGLALALPAAAATLAQIWVIAVVQRGTHLAEVPLALPTEPAFWAFLLGKIGRSLMLPVDRPWLSLAVTATVALLAAAVFGRQVHRLVRGAPKPLADVRPGLVYVALGAAVFAYLLIIAAGRTHLRPPEVETFVEFFGLGFRRFHFFWVTLLWPWLAAALWAMLPRRIGQPVRFGLLVVPALIVAALFEAGAFRHPAYYRHTMDARAAGTRCLLAQLQRGQGIDCPELDPADLTLAVVNGKQAGASFARGLPSLPSSSGDADPAPLARLTPASTPAWTLQDLTLERQSPAAFELRAGGDGAILFDTGQRGTLERCVILEVLARQRVSEDDTAQLFFRRPGQHGFSEAWSQKAAIAAGGAFREVAFELVSRHGFADGLRFDPVTRAQRFELQGLEVRCRMTLPERPQGVVPRLP